MLPMISYIRKKIKYSRMIGYTTEYSEKAERLNCKGGGMLTAEEHSRMSEIDFQKHFKSEQTLIKWYFSYLENINHLSVVSTAGVLIKETKAKNILSFGCGPAVNELLLKCAFQDDIRMVVTDYDEFMMKGIQRICGDKVHAQTFDFYKDNPCRIINQYNIDTVIMIGSACSMDDKTYIKFLRKLKKTKVKYILTFEAGIQKEWMRIFYPFGLVLKTICLYFFNRNEYNDRLEYMENRVTYHAFNRTISELKHIYRKGGFQYTRIGPTKNRYYHTYTNSFLLYSKDTDWRKQVEK